MGILLGLGLISILILATLGYFLFLAIKNLTKDPTIRRQKKWLEEEREKEVMQIYEEMKRNENRKN